MKGWQFDISCIFSLDIDFVSNFYSYLDNWGYNWLAGGAIVSFSTRRYLITMIIFVKLPSNVQTQLNFSWLE